MPIDPRAPSLEVSLPLDRFAPRAARHHVGQVDNPSPDLRDAVVLLTSELVNRAVKGVRRDGEECFELRVWMPADVVRVEVRAPRVLLGMVRGPDGAELDGLLFGGLADRWSIARAPGAESATWFEIDRRRPRLHSSV
jgi:hypothetical protein